jgi:thiol-disulfide isomerase/thioredoxin
MQISLILKHFGNNPRGFAELRISVDFILNSLINDEEKLNHIADYLFERFEQKSLFEVSEYLALQLLNQNSCKLNDDLAKQLEIYRKMKVGNTAPFIIFKGDTYRNGDEISDVFLNSTYTVVVFGASWCPGCTEMMPLLVNAYSNWQKRGVEIIFVSLDTQEEEFKQYAQKFPFISTCDFKKWEGENVSNYYVFATPTMFVLDENNKIVLRPHHPKQIDDWIKK